MFASILKGIFNLILIITCVTLFHSQVLLFREEIDESFWSDEHVEIITKNVVSWENITVNDVRLNVLQCGAANSQKKELVLLLHGFPETGLLSWYHQIGPICDAGFHVVVPDMRGYNSSQKPAHISDYRQSKLVNDVVGLIKYFGKDNAHIIGHDWGGIISWLVAAEHPDVVKSLTILNACHLEAFKKLILELHDFNQMISSYYIAYFQVPILTERAISKNDFLGLRTVFKDSTGLDRKTFSKDYIQRSVHSFSQPEVLTSALNYYRAIPFDTYSSFISGVKTNKITSPTLVIWGKKDIALSYKLGELSLEHCENGKLIIIEDAAHFVQHDQPERVSSEIISFLKSSK